uniref:Uncharacterized protein n=1 Tax=viral metagenome TaxID=1070528 RepID=A0A6C0BKJ2_9ZZZZ
MNEILRLDPKFCIGSLIERCTWDQPIDLELTRTLNRLGVYGANRQYSLNGDGRGYELELRSREHPSLEDLQIIPGIHSIDTSREGKTIVRFKDLGGVSELTVNRMIASCKYLACNILKY